MRRTCMKYERARTGNNQTVRLGNGLERVALSDPYLSNASLPEWIFILASCCAQWHSEQHVHRDFCGALHAGFRNGTK